MKIQLLQKQNLESFAKLVRLVIQTSPYYNPWAIEAEAGRLSHSHLVEMMQSDDHLLIQVTNNNTIVGFRIAQFDENLLWLDWTGLLEEYRGKGIGKQIHQFTIDYIRENRPDITKIWCDTTVDNQESIRVLEKLGFNKIAELKKHWYKLDYYLWEKYL